MKPSGFAAGFDGLTPLVVLLHYRGYGSQVVQTSCFRRRRSKRGVSIQGPLPGTACGVALKRSRQVRRNPAAIEAAGLWPHHRPVYRATQTTRVKSDASCQRLSACQRARVAPSDAVQAIVAIDQRPILRRPLPLAKRATGLLLQQVFSHIRPRQIETGWVGCLQHLDCAASAGNLELAPADDHFPRVRRELRWSRKVPYGGLTGPRRLRKWWAGLAAPLPVVAGGLEPVGGWGNRGAISHKKPRFLIAVEAAIV